MRARRRGRWLRAAAVVLLALGLLAALFVSLDLLEIYFLQDISMGMRHALLTAHASLITGLVAGVILVTERRRNRRLATTARELTRLLESFQHDPQNCGRFENPHLVTCHDVINCGREECRRLSRPNHRCWQDLALRHPEHDAAGVAVSLRECQACPVYRLSCPDAVTELGEAINNTLHLLEEGAGQIGRLRAAMAERQTLAALGEVAAGVAHEICNPLSSISSVVQMLRRRPTSQIDKAQLEALERDIQRISTIVRQMSRPPGPTTPPLPRADMAGLVRGDAGHEARPGT